MHSICIRRIITDGDQSGVYTFIVDTRASHHTLVAFDTSILHFVGCVYSADRVRPMFTAKLVDLLIGFTNTVYEYDIFTTLVK